MKNIKEKRAGVKLRYCQQASRCTVCGYWRHENGICRFTLSITTICACLPLEEWLISLSDKQYVRFRLWCGT
jgi:hypothetical protein